MTDPSNIHLTETSAPSTSVGAYGTSCSETSGSRTQNLPGHETGFSNPMAPGELGSLGPYRIVRLLGHGAMGEVYAAIDTRLNRKIALKIMLPKFASDPVARQRFLREARAAATVTHDNIVTIYEADVTGGIPFIAMQFLEGYPLDQYLKKKGTPPLSQILQIGLETAQGLAAAHGAGLIHRDIKPGNLWLEAPDGRVKILDFGLAKSEENEVELTHTGAVLGTPAYMSPEQARGHHVDARTDLFSLGSVLYRLCSGKLPFEGGSTMAVLIALGTEDPKPLGNIVPNLPIPLVNLIHQLMSKKQEDRPQSASEVVNQLKAISQNLRGDIQRTTEPPSEESSRVQITAFPQGDPFAPGVFNSPKGAYPKTTKRVKTKSFSRPIALVMGLVGTTVFLGVFAFFSLDFLTGKKNSQQQSGREKVQTAASESSLENNTSAPKVASSIAPKSAERAAAEWIIQMGGAFLVKGGTKGIGRLEDLPKEDFQITALKLREKPINDEGLKHLESLTALSFLDLSRTPIKGQGLRHISNLRELKILNLSETAISDEILMFISPITSLGMLDLGKTEITDQGLTHLTRLKDLDSMILEGTKATTKGVEILGKELPKCKIHLIKMGS